MEMEVFFGFNDKYFFDFRVKKELNQIQSEIIISKIFNIGKCFFFILRDTISDID